MDDPSVVVAPDDVQYMLTTVIDYGDYYVGQVLGVGTQANMLKLQELIPAVSVRGGRTPLRAWTSVAELPKGLTAGMPWQMRNPSFQPAPETPQ